jgi:prepilin-type N-terminal cleavage/methylation domain-containing protein
MRGLHRHRGGFTLIELLVVIGILAILLAILMPTIGMATQLVRANTTRNQMKEIALSLKAFKNDFSDYPPSKPAGSSVDPGKMTTSAANLVYYLMGPARSGWGTGAGGQVPFGESSSTRQYGPYYLADQDLVLYDTANPPKPVAFLDAFRPAGRILYFKYCKNPTTPGQNYSVTDNGAADSTGKLNYSSQTRLEELTKMTLATKPSVVTKWVDEGFLLISPGPDGRYGYVKVDGATGEISSCSSSEGKCDDITNWN